MSCTIVGLGIPNQRAASCNRAAAIDTSLVPTASEAVSSFHATGGRLQLLSKFGEDPLDGHTSLQQNREEAFVSRFPSFEPIFHQVSNGDSTPFKEAIIFFIDLTNRLVTQI